MAGRAFDPHGDSIGRIGTAVTKRWPVPLAILVGLIVAGVVSHEVWVRLVVFVAVESTAAVIFRLVAGWRSAD